MPMTFHPKECIRPRHLFWLLVTTKALLNFEIRWSSYCHSKCTYHDYCNKHQTLELLVLSILKINVMKSEAKWILSARCSQPICSREYHHTADKPKYLFIKGIWWNNFTGVLKLIPASTSDGQERHLEVFSFTFHKPFALLPPSFRRNSPQSVSFTFHYLLHCYLQRSAARSSPQSTRTTSHNNTDEKWNEREISMRVLKIFILWHVRRVLVWNWPYYQCSCPNWHQGLPGWRTISR